MQRLRLTKQEHLCAKHDPKQLLALLLIPAHVLMRRMKKPKPSQSSFNQCFCHRQVFEKVTWNLYKAELFTKVFGERMITKEAQNLY